MRGNNTSSYLEAQNRTDIFRKINYSNLIQEDGIGHVILEFKSYIPANNKIRIRGVDVQRFGLGSSRNHSVVDKDTFFIDKKKSTRSRWINFYVYLYMGYLNGQHKAQKGEKGEKGQGFALTADMHIHLNNKRITNL